MKRMVQPMRILLATLLMLSTGALAQTWPSETGLQRDGFRGSIDALERFRGPNDSPRFEGEELRGRVGGWAGAVRGWFQEQGEKVGQNESDSARYFNLRREWEGDLGRRR